MHSTVRSIVLGSPLATAKEIQQRLTKLQALAIFSSDALSSVAYATEEILLALIVAGSGALGLSLPIAVVIAVLLVIVANSFYQTIHGYPSGGGAYIVAHQNLGIWPGLVAAAALLIDYVLTVAVSITAGVAAITSAFPALLPYQVWVCLLAIVLVMWANLRGVKESGRIFAIPTYGFILIVTTLITIGIVRILTGTLGTASAPAETEILAGSGALTSFLILRAFASGCTALTGVEAISNGIPAFKKPEADNAGKTLIAMAALLVTMFLGITVLARASQVVPIAEQTVLSQIGRLVFGQGPLYLALQVLTALILVLAANTSYAGFPRLAAILAQDRYLPSQLTNLGDRLVFANGIVVLAVLASVLVVLFGGQTHGLIPLYAIGVFLSFTLSQIGMVRHWVKGANTSKRMRRVMVNGLGAAGTGVVLIVVIVTKFIHGAWIVILLIPVFVWAFHRIRNHYASVARQLSLDGMDPEAWADVTSSCHYSVVVPVSGMHRGTLAALRFARSLSANVTAVIVDVDPAATSRTTSKWSVWGHGVPLVVLASPYRSTVGPLTEYLERVDTNEPYEESAVVVLPEFVPARWWHRLLHNQTALLLRSVLLYQQGQTGKDRVIVNVPYHLHQ